MVSGWPLCRCLSKMQVFQLSFEICPFEAELNMDIAAALKVRAGRCGPGAAPTLAPLWASSSTCYPVGLPHPPRGLAGLSCREATASGMTGS